MAQTADPGLTRPQHTAAVSLRCCHIYVRADDHFRRLVHDTQIGRIDIGDLACLIDHTDTILHRLQDELQPFLHERVLMQQPVDLAHLRFCVHLEIAGEKPCHFPYRCGGILPLTGYEYRIAALHLQRDQQHEIVQFNALAARAAQVKAALVLYIEFLGLLHNHGRNPHMQTIFVLYHDFLLKHLAQHPFIL